jgi:chorismate synthase
MAMSIPAVKGVEIGTGFENAMKPGSQVHDAIYWEEGRGYYRRTNRAGGTEGGMSTGEELVVRAALKPIATLMTPLPTVDVVTHQPADAARERSDTTAVPAASVILEALTGIVLAQAYLEKFGGDTLEELVERVERYKEHARTY